MNFRSEGLFKTDIWIQVRLGGPLESAALYQGTTSVVP
jgi:hypothetical protein